MPKIKCFGQDYLTDENIKIAEGLIKQEIEKQLELPELLGFFIDIDFDVSLKDFRIDIPYNCNPITLNSKNACKPIIKNGNINQKEDILFIGDGFESDEDLNNTIAEVLDYEGNQTGTKKEGLFSEEPFKSNKNKFNIWYINPDRQIGYSITPLFPSNGKQPNIKEILEISNNCPWYDHTIVLSKRNKYRSNCMIGKPGGPCRVSLANVSYPGRLVLHEFGHGFAALFDEYHRLVNRRNNNREL